MLKTLGLGFRLHFVVHFVSNFVVHFVIDFDTRLKHFANFSLLNLWYISWYISWYILGLGLRAYGLELRAHGFSGRADLTQPGQAIFCMTSRTFSI